MTAEYSQYLRSLTRLVGLEQEKEKKLEAFRSEQQQKLASFANQELREKAKIEQKLSAARSQLTEFLRKSRKRIPPRASVDADGVNALGFDDARVELLRVLLKLEKLHEAEINEKARRSRERAIAAAEALNLREENLARPGVPQAPNKDSFSPLLGWLISVVFLVASVVATLVHIFG